MKKFIDTIINMLKDFKYAFVFAIIFYFVLNINLPYYIYTPGGIENISSKYKISSETKSDGTYNLVYVSSYKANIALYFSSLFNSSWDVVETSNVEYENETSYDVDVRDQLYLKQSQQNAILNSYKKAEKEYVIKDTHLMVVYLVPDSDTELKIGDEILKVDGIKVETYEQLTSYIDGKNVSNELKITVKRNKKEKEVTAKIINYNGEKVVGVSIFKIYDIETKPNISFDFNSNESGPSAGLMMTLSIYDCLVKKDLTHDFKIAGTGTIDEDGNVGEIGEVENKLRSAVKGNADIFFVPVGANYNDAKKLADKNNYDIIIVGVSTFNEAVDYLNSLD